MKLDALTHHGSSFLDSLAESWQHLRQSASSALTRFRQARQDNLPFDGTDEDALHTPSLGWSVLGADLFEDDRRLIVRVEIPGMEKEALKVEVQDDALVVSGEKRSERNATQGQYRVLQCAYGHFRRSVPLPVAVLSDKASATYRNGVLRVELPKAEQARPRRTTLAVS